MASLWSELEALGNDVGTRLDYGPDVKVVLLTYADGAFTRAIDIPYGVAVDEAFDPVVGADGFLFMLPILDPAVEALIYDLAVQDLAFVIDPAMPASIFHILRKKPAVIEPRQAPVFTQRVEDVWDDEA